ncbi:MAG: hypothetical protein M3P01_03660 [Actinomycetota bacterium]|nr:hypothetical protein [Actinomycetota bacterium]
MDIRVSMREHRGRWSARASLQGRGDVTATAATRQRCLAAIRRSVEQALAGDGRAGAITLIVEASPVLAGVAEAAEVMGWDKRRVITYIDRGRFPEPLQALASGRIWLRSDVEAFAEQWRARRMAGGARAPSTARPRERR